MEDQARILFTAERWAVVEDKLPKLIEKSVEEMETRCLSQLRLAAAGLVWNNMSNPAIEARETAPLDATIGSSSNDSLLQSACSFFMEAFFGYTHRQESFPEFGEFYHFDNIGNYDDIIRLYKSKVLPSNTESQMFYRYPDGFVPRSHPLLWSTSKLLLRALHLQEDVDMKTMQDIGRIIRCEVCCDAGLSPIPFMGWGQIVSFISTLLLMPYNASFTGVSFHYNALSSRWDTHFRRERCRITRFNCSSTSCVVGDGLILVFVPYLLFEEEAFCQCLFFLL